MDEKIEKEKGNLPLPKVLAINICDQIIQDAKTHKMSLIGLFNRIQSQHFPVPHSLMHVYVALTDGHGSYNAELRFVNLTNSQIIAKMTGPLIFKNPLQVTEMNFEIRNLAFRSEGKHSVQFCCNGQEIGNRDFFVAGPKTVPPPISESGG